MLEPKLTRESFISEVIEKLYDAGFDNSASSNIRKIIEAIVSEEFFNSIKTALNGLNFSTMESEDLDYLFDEVFGIPRFTQTIVDDQNLFVFNYNNSDNEPIFLDIGTQFKYLNEYYLVTENKKFIASDNIQTNSIYCKKLYSTLNFDKVINCGEITFNFSDKIHIGNLSYEEIKTIMENNFAFIEQTNKSDNKETDTEYRIRANKIFQNMGYNNIQIIINKISSLFGVVSVSYKEYDFYTEIFIIPKNLSLLNSIFDSAKEICDYYKVSSIKLRKPPVVNFVFNGIHNNFDSRYTDLKEKIQLYISDMQINGGTFNRDNFENFLYDYGNSKTSGFVLYEDNIKISYEIYGENNYIDQQNAMPVIVKTIPKNTSKTFNGVLFTCGDIN